MGHQSAKPDIGEVGVFCRVCHRWSDGQSDLCHHCLERLLGSRPLSKDSVAVWVGGQVDEHRALGIPVPAEDQALLRRWASFHSVNLIAEADDNEAAVIASRTQELMTERDMSWKEAWQSAEQEWSVASGLPPTSAHRKKRSKWLRLAGIGAILVFAAIFVASVDSLFAELLFDPTSDTGAVLPVTRWIFLAASLLGITLVEVGIIGWVVTAGNWRDFFSSLTWGDFFSSLTRVGTIVTIGLFALAGIMAFSGQDGTDLEGKENAFFFLLLRGVPTGVLVALIGSLGSAGVRFHHRRATTASSALDTDRQN
jgi:hypothetical protein